jgi:hypothetical protein
MACRHAGFSDVGFCGVCCKCCLISSLHLSDDGVVEVNRSLLIRRGAVVAVRRREGIVKLVGVAWRRSLGKAEVVGMAVPSAAVQLSRCEPPIRISR